MRIIGLGLLFICQGVQVNILPFKKNHQYYRETALKQDNQHGTNIIFNLIG